MSEKTRVVAVRLVRIEFLSKGAEPVSARTRHALTSVTVWPRYACPARATARDVQVDGAARDYADGDWLDAILFKENVQLPSAVEFRLSVPLSDEALGKALAAVARAGAALAGDAAQAAAPTAALGKVATAPLDAFATLLGGATDPDELGRAALLFDEELLARGGTRTVEFVAREAVSARVSVSPAATAAASRRRRKAVEKGAVVARAVLAFDALG